jgi:hypothetical protein
MNFIIHESINEGSILMFYGSKYGGLKICFVIYLKKIKKQSHIDNEFHKKL